MITEKPVQATFSQTFLTILLKRRFFFGFICLLFPAFAVQPVAAGSASVNPELVKRDFMRVMLSAEFGGNTRFGRSIKKYNRSVRFAIINHAKEDRRAAVRSFIWELPEKIEGFDASVVSDPDRANFRIHVVDQDQYADVIRNDIYNDRRAKVRGQCFVHVMPGKRGIQETNVVIVSDRGERIFNRCLVEEVLQGLGPLADKGHQDYSIFNTASQHSSFTLHDRVLMNALYDPRIKAGMSKAEVKKVLPAVIHDCVARITLNP